MRTLFEELSVPGKGNARVVDHALVHRASNQRGKFTVQAAITGTRQRIDNVKTVIGAELTRGDGGAKRDGKNR
ncbi:hypothetical protein D3C84_1276040 [compost metagenome]